MPFFKLRFINTPGFVSSAIDWVTFSRMDHAEIQTDAGTWLGAHAGSGIEERAADYCVPIWERRYAVPMESGAYACAMAFAQSKIGTPYNYLDILGLFLHRDLPGARGSRREICSMFVFETALAGGLQMLNVLPGYSHLVTPETLHLSPYLIGRCTYKKGV